MWITKKFLCIWCWKKIEECFTYIDLNMERRAEMEDEAAAKGAGIVNM
jgi:hypothetical protein